MWLTVSVVFVFVCVCVLWYRNVSCEVADWFCCFTREKHFD